MMDTFDLTGLVPPVFGFVWAAAWLVPAIASLVGGGIAALSNNAAANANRRATQTATDAQSASIDKQLAYEREAEARRREDARRTEDENARMWASEVAREQGNTDRLFAEDVQRDRRREPYRVAGRAALADLDARRQGSMADLMPLGRI